MALEPCLLAFEPRHTAVDLEGQLSQDGRRDALGSKVALGRKVHASTSPGQQQILHSIDHLFLSPSFSFVPQSLCHRLSDLGISVVIYKQAGF